MENRLNYTIIQFIKTRLRSKSFFFGTRDVLLIKRIFLTVKVLTGLGTD